MTAPAAVRCELHGHCIAPASDVARKARPTEGTQQWRRRVVSVKDSKAVEAAVSTYTEVKAKEMQLHSLQESITLDNTIQTI